MLAGLRTQRRSTWPPGLDGGPTLARDARPSPHSVATAAGAAAAPHSTTNVHEAGVDEPDLVKTDGNRVITVTGGVLRVIDTATRKVTGYARARPRSRRWAPADLLVSGDRALVLFPGGGIMPLGAMAKAARPAGPVTCSSTCPARRRCSARSPPQGAHVDARMVGSTVRLVVRSQPTSTSPSQGPTSPEASCTQAERRRTAGADRGVAAEDRDHRRGRRAVRRVGHLRPGQPSGRLHRHLDADRAQPSTCPRASRRRAPPRSAWRPTATPSTAPAAACT